MRCQLGPGLAAAALVVALAAIPGCGGGGGGDEGGAIPTRTATPLPTSTPTPVPVATATPAPAATVSVAFDLGASVPLAGLQFTATYPAAKGSFTGSGDAVECATAAAGVLTKNDQDTGALVLSIASATALALPAVVGCTFDLAGGQRLRAADIEITARQATDAKGVSVDAATLTVAVRVE